MPRLFTALEIPSSVALQLSFLQSGLLGARWIDRENFHITLRFIGDVERPLALEFAEAFSGTKAVPFQLQLNELDIFGNSKPHALFAKVRYSETLSELRAGHDRICQRLGVSADSRKFVPHVTIARLRGSKTPDIAKYLSMRGDFQSPVFDVARFVLLSSRDSIGGGPYVIEESYSFREDDLVVS